MKWNFTTNIFNFSLIYSLIHQNSGSEYCDILLPLPVQKFILHLTVNTHAVPYKDQWRVIAVVRLF